MLVEREGAELGEVVLQALVDEREGLLGIGLGSALRAP